MATPRTSPLDAEKSVGTVAPLSVAAGWPGLIFWLGGGVFRAGGYFAFVLAGICAARKDGAGVFVCEFLLGHGLICAAQAIDKMNDERKRDSSANNAMSHERSELAP